MEFCATNRQMISHHFWQGNSHSQAYILVKDLLLIIKEKKKNHSQWYLSVTTVNSHLFSLPTLLSPSLPSSLVPMCSILAGTKLCYGNKWLGRDVSMGGPPFLTHLSLEQLPSQMGRASITLLSGTWRSPKQSRAPVVM